MIYILEFHLLDSKEFPVNVRMYTSIHNEEEDNVKRQKLKIVQIEDSENGYFCKSTLLCYRKTSQIQKPLFCKNIT